MQYSPRMGTILDRTTTIARWMASRTKRAIYEDAFQPMVGDVLDFAAGPNRRIHQWYRNRSERCGCGGGWGEGDEQRHRCDSQCNHELIRLLYRPESGPGNLHCYCRKAGLHHRAV